MILHTDFPCKLEPLADPTSITIGNFDGLHSGHQKLLRATAESAEQLAVRSCAMTFDPSPREFFSKKREPINLYSVAQRARCLAEFGISLIVIQSFDERLANVSRESFLQDFLIGGLQMKAITVGENFRFGKDRKGSPEWLVASSKPADFAAKVITPSLHEDGWISSTSLRKLILEEGDVSTAREFLGRPHAIEGIVNTGGRLGRKIGFPTINLGQVEQALPKIGVYSGYVWIGEEDQFPSLLQLPDQVYPAAINIGYKPTVAQDQPHPTVEAHLIDQKFGADSLYGKRACVFLVSRIREERRFPDIDSLKTQLHRDISDCLNNLST